MTGQTIATVIAIAAFICAAFAEPQSENYLRSEPAELTNTNGALRGVVDRVDMRVTQLRAGANAAELEHILGRPTKVSQGLGSDTLALVYADQPLRTSVTLARDHVTAIALDVLPIDTALLPERARTVKPTMVRAGVLALLGNPNADERWTASGIETEQMVYRGTHESDFSVFLADGLVVDVKPRADKPSEIEHIILPSAIPDGSVGTALSIGLNPKQAAPLLGPPAWTPAMSTLKGQPTQYATYHEREGGGFVSLTFMGGTLTAFSVWSPNSTMSCGDTCLSH